MIDWQSRALAAEQERDQLKAAKKWADDLSQWLKLNAELNGKSAEEWNKSEPNCGQSIWRNGMGLGLLEALTALQRLQRGENILNDFAAN